MSSFNEAMSQIRELEERAMEELKEIVQVGRDWLSTVLERDLGFAPTGLQVVMTRGSPLH